MLGFDFYIELEVPLITSNNPAETAWAVSFIVTFSGFILYL